MGHCILGKFYRIASPRYIYTYQDATLICINYNRDTPHCNFHA
jgi:hypothetical protein